MGDQKFKVVELDSIKMEDGAKELMSTPEMQPYLRYIEAVMLEHDVGPSLQEIAELPLEKRYVWRVASALKWGFADFEDWNVAVDRKTLKPEDADKVIELFWRCGPLQRRRERGRRRRSEEQQHPEGGHDHNGRVEVDRYIIWPGQATAYMIGMLEIRAARDGAQRALGPRFEIKAFHDRVLEDGAVPLTFLTGKIRKWAAGSSASKP